MPLKDELASITLTATDNGIIFATVVRWNNEPVAQIALNKNEVSKFVSDYCRMLTTQRVLFLREYMNRNKKGDSVENDASSPLQPPTPELTKTPAPAPAAKPSYESMDDEQL